VQQGTSFVSQFETLHQKSQKQGQVKISTKDVHVYYGETEAIKGIDMIFIKMK
jgi:phosphate transport system ATP-binding protein